MPACIFQPKIWNVYFVVVVKKWLANLSYEGCAKLPTDTSKSQYCITTMNDSSAYQLVTSEAVCRETTSDLKITNLIKHDHLPLYLTIFLIVYKSLLQIVYRKIILFFPLSSFSLINQNLVFKFIVFKCTIKYCGLYYYYY